MGTDKTDMDLNKLMLSFFVKLVEKLVNPKALWGSVVSRLRRYFISDIAYARLRFKREYGRQLNLNSPRSFNEKMQWLKLYDRRGLLTKCADKILVRAYVGEKIGTEYLIPLLTIANRPEEIDFSTLPDRFVIKMNHGSGYNIIVWNKSELNQEDFIRKINRWRVSNYYYQAREWQYKNIKPRILVEELLLDTESKIPADYKFFCFPDKDRCSFVVQLDFDRFGNHSRVYFDENWHRMPFTIKYPTLNGYVPKPKRFDEMKQLAWKLAKDFSFVRVDFYILQEKIYFGELTFHPDAGFSNFIPRDFDFTLGEMLNLKTGNNISQLKTPTSVIAL